MCVDYTDLNKAHPADPFALPRIDQIIDATAGCVGDIPRGINRLEV